MSPRTGRPKSENPKSIDVKVRIDKETNNKLEKCSTETGKSRAELIRQSIIEFLERRK
ncbi:MAG: CopG family transcriptional regulator [Clostridia bacterium]|nr:CopG family transcriptional regulator [Clostridia bacterium]